MRMLIKKTRHNGFKVYVRVMVLRWVRNSRVLARASIFLDLRLSDDVNVIQPFIQCIEQDKLQATLLQSPLYASGTVFRSISHLLRHFPSSALA